MCRRRLCCKKGVQAETAITAEEVERRCWKKRMEEKEFAFEAIGRETCEPRDTIYFLVLSIYVCHKHS